MQDRFFEFLDRAGSGVRLIAVHEVDALQGHWSDVQERWDAARRAPTHFDMLREQMDLVSESRRRVLRDHHVRIELVRGLLKDLSLH